MAKKKKEDKEGFKDIERCDYCMHNNGEHERFEHMWYCNNMKRYLPQGYSFCRASQLNKGNFEVNKLKYKQLNNKL